MAGEETTNIRQEINYANAGMNLDQSVNQIKKGQLTYALNAAVENFDANSVNYQNEPGNEQCIIFPEGYHVIGTHLISEKNKLIFFLTHPETGDSEIGYMENNDCVYRTLVNAPCLNFNIDHPIPKVVHKITNCTTEIYWTDGYNPRRYLDLENIPYIISSSADPCNPSYTNQLDCNQLKIQPNFAIPELEIKEVLNGGNLVAGTYQFAIQYANAQGVSYSSYYSVTNPTPIADTHLTTPDFNYPVGKSIVINITNLDLTGYFEYFNLAVIKTVNNATTVELVGTYFIDKTEKQITYTGQNVTQIALSMNDIFEKYPYYDIADDITTVQDILVWKGLTSIDRTNYQQIANQIDLKWQTYKLPANENYANEVNATNLRGYMRDEVYAFEIVFLLKNGKQTDGFHIPGRAISFNESTHPDVPDTNPDFIGEGTSAPYWKIYNTASVIGPATGPNIGNATPYQYGEFAYWESTETYPCNTEVWGTLANQPIRHHKFPDVRVSPIFESASYDTSGAITPVISKRSIFPIGVNINVDQVRSLIQTSSLTAEQKADVVGFKIVRGDRATNKSIIAKGILRNVGEYNREGTSYYFPNYPYNDLRQDPFLLEKNNAYNSICKLWKLVVTGDGFYQYTDCYTNAPVSVPMTNGDTIEQCSITTPVVSSGSATITEITYELYQLTSTGGYTTFQYVSPITGLHVSEIVYNGVPETVKVDSGTTPIALYSETGDYTITKISQGTNAACYPSNLQAFGSSSKSRQVFNSPDTSFGTPFLGNVLKLENTIFGAGKAHFVQVKKNAFYKLISKEAQEDALKSSEDIANVTGTFNASAMFAAYQAYLTIYINGITRKNYAYSYNSLADYDYWASIDNGIGIKQRKLETAQYLVPGVQSVGDDKNFNNYQRESSIFVKTNHDILYPNQIPSLLIGGVTPAIEDKSRYTISEKNHCSKPEEDFDISTVCYYGSIKNVFDNQWGQIYSYNTIDTGFQKVIGNTSVGTVTFFGGDTFINRFSFKTKLPFFIDNRVGAPDDSDIFYDEIGNVAYPQYWHSARSVLYDYVVTATTPDQTFKNLISVKAHNFDCPNNQLPAPDLTATPPIVNPNRTYYDGKFYLFAYGIPTFYCESTVNVDLRQAYNNKEGDFYPHVSNNIPDDWVQESNVSIAYDNTYYYNATFSKQNKENFFSHLPVDWDGNQCFTTFPFRAIYSDQQESEATNKVNNWLSYGALSYFDFPQNYGKLTSLDGIQNKAVLARFENKSLLYNTLLTVETSNPKAAYLGNDTLFRSSPPIDFAETDLGYVGSQHKMLLKIPQGQITVDAKRGQVFLITGNGAQDLSAFGSGLNRFFTDHLAFEILRYFPNVPIDNNFKGLGLHGVYDSKYDRVIISKLDYIPLPGKVIKYDSSTDEFYVEKTYPQYQDGLPIDPLIVREVIQLTNQDYFCNKSWTISYNVNTQSWTSFHSYIPNWYVAENNFFYSGLNEGCDLEAIAAIDTGLPVTTTTTTTILPPTPTTSTTTTLAPDCTIEGIASVMGCEIVGTADLVTTTTTTTLP